MGGINSKTFNEMVDEDAEGSFHVKSTNGGCTTMSD